MCINDKHWHNDTRCPAFGEIVTVEKSFKSPISGDPVYSFTEYPPVNPHKIRCFSQKYFAPLSDLDETTLVNEEWEEKVCEPVNEKSCSLNPTTTLLQTSPA
jgi:hypothetical protein